MVASKMVLSKSLASLLLPVLALVSLSVRASPRPRTPLSTDALKLAIKFNPIQTRSAVGQARARALLQRDASSISTASVEGLVFSASVGVGSPPTYYTLLVDTGSSNTWVGANKSYEKTSTSQDTGDQFHDSYGSGTEIVVGEEYLDTVTLNSGLIITQQSIGVAEYGTNANLPVSLDGILGLGPVDLTENTVSNTYQVPTVMNNLYAQGTISSEVLGAFFSPASIDDGSGELTFGGYDSSKITGDVNYVPITSTSPSNEYWGVDLSISYGNTVILAETAGVVDTGTPTIPIATDAYNEYKSATGATYDNNSGLLMISSDQYANLSSLYFNIGGVSYELTPNAQIWPRSLNVASGLSADGIYLIVTDTGSNSGSGSDFTLGHCFLQRFYSVYDRTNSQVGFATTEYTTATSN
ncbi:acid protease [Rhizopogon salebrosus TDB-379]|nr:acid protease [Rhizopogon salebrosus TDB-379]